MEIIAVLAFLALTGWRLEKLALQFFTLADRKLKLDETRTTHREERPPLPTDLFMWCSQESEIWAIEDKKKILYEYLDQLGSWDAVRKVIRETDGSAN